MQQLERNWRSIILFGRNVASYKFTLAKVLLDASEGNRAHTALHDLTDMDDFLSRLKQKELRQEPAERSARSLSVVNLLPGVVLC